MNLDPRIEHQIEEAKHAHASGQFVEAIALYEQLRTELPPEQTARIDCNLGAALASVGRIDEAIAAYRRSIEAAPDATQPLNNLANLIRDSGDLDEAIALLDRALLLAPNDAVVHNNRAAALELAGRINDAIAGYQRAVELAPNLPNPFDNLVYAMHFSPRYSARDLLEAHQRWATKFAESHRSRWPKHLNDRSPDRKLRVGLVSPDFREHVVGRFILPLLEHHDRDAFEFICYSNAIGRPDETTERMYQSAEGWRWITSSSDDDAALQVYKDRVDILIDLTLHMTRNRLGIFALKPAPVQATYLAYASTSGMSAIEYRITDPHIDALESDETVYAERSIRLPTSYWCYDPPVQAHFVADAPPRDGPIVFGCLNNFNKCSIDTRETWREILRAVPDSQLLVHARHGSHRNDFTTFFEAGGIDPARIDFVGLQTLGDYYAAYHRIDIALDPFPYGGGTTTCDALWMNRPVVTLRGNTAVGRGGASIITNVGLPELIASTREEYIERAVFLATNQSQLRALQSSLRELMEASPLMDRKRFAREFEGALRTMWKRYVEAPSV